MIVQYGLKKHPELPDVAWIYDYAKTDGGSRGDGPCRSAIRNSAVRSLLRRACRNRWSIYLRTAFEQTMNDPEFRADAEKRQVDLDFTSGAEIQSLIEKFYKTPPAVIERVKTIVEHTAQ